MLKFSVPCGLVQLLHFAMKVYMGCDDFLTKLGSD